MAKVKVNTNPNPTTTPASETIPEGTVPVQEVNAGADLTATAMTTTARKPGRPPGTAKDDLRWNDNGKARLKALIREYVKGSKDTRSLVTALKSAPEFQGVEDKVTTLNVGRKAREIVKQHETDIAAGKPSLPETQVPYLDRSTRTLKDSSLAELAYVAPEGEAAPTA